MGLNASHAAPQACFYCKKRPENIMKCSKCPALYCNETCQLRDWRKRFHKKECFDGDKEDYSVVHEPQDGRLPDFSKCPFQIGQKFLVHVFTPSVRACDAPLTVSSVEHHAWSGDISFWDKNYTAFKIILLMSVLATRRPDEGPGSHYFWAEFSAAGEVRVYPEKPLNDIKRFMKLVTRVEKEKKEEKASTD